MAPQAASHFPTSAMSLKGFISDSGGHLKIVFFHDFCEINSSLLVSDVCIYDVLIGLVWHNTIKRDVFNSNYVKHFSL